jgi:hypothetical protein
MRHQPAMIAKERRFPKEKACHKLPIFRDHDPSGIGS